MEKLKYWLNFFTHVKVKKNKINKAFKIYLEYKSEKNNHHERLNRSFLVKTLIGWLKVDKLIKLINLRWRTTIPAFIFWGLHLDNLKHLDSNPPCFPCVKKKLLKPCNRQVFLIVLLDWLSKHLIAPNVNSWFKPLVSPLKTAFWST